MKKQCKNVGAIINRPQSNVFQCFYGRLIDAPTEYQKNNKGITLIALVVTIIVLLILAGVSLSLVAGGNGIIGKAEKALSETQKAALKEQAELAIAELQMEYYLENDGTQSFEEFLKEKCGTEGFEMSNGGRFYVDDDGNLVYENDDGSVLLNNENGNLVPDEIISNTGEDTTAPQISTLTTTNSITIIAKDRASGVIAYAITESETEPSDWTSVSKTKRLEKTITGKNKNTTYYVWAKDASGNVSYKTAKTLDFETFTYTTTWEENLAVITVTSPKTGVEFNDGTGWKPYSDENKPKVASGTTVQFQITDGTNTQTCASVQPLKKSMVRYNLNGGSGTLPANVEKTHKDRVVVDTTATLTKTGYTFLGWAQTSNATGGITEFTMPGEDVILYAVWQEWPLATTAISATNYGDGVNYSANGVEDWKIFLNDGSHVYLIATGYVPNSGLNKAENIADGYGSYGVYATEKDNGTTLLNWLTDSSYWTNYAEGKSNGVTISGATATGGPTLDQYVESWNAKGYMKIYTKTDSTGCYLGVGTSENPTSSFAGMSSTSGYNDTLYYPYKGGMDGCAAYWLASLADRGVVAHVADNGAVSCNQLGYGESHHGVRPLVCLPDTAKMSWNGSQWILSN